MGTLVLLLLVAALLVGGIGMVVEGLFWLVVIAGALLLAGLVLGITRRGASRRETGTHA